ncbi:MAG: phosphatidylinositol-specific phospholipase C/glycerophosphodiester phosphodiesterase family protein [Chitinophagales bacterium]|nr:phosphatidylinositol-specific phospholipase C/glycerophosphodiester phosphodiesterase family protein [Chitinophagales bacterium]
MRLLLLLFPVLLQAQVKPLSQAHAHNDYEHGRPLLDALDQGFAEVEADVFLIDGDLYVSHVMPLWKDSTRTLQSLYLDPLKWRIEANGGRVFPADTGFFYFMIDIKTEPDTTYKVIQKQLMNYAAMISLVRDSLDEPHKPVKVFLSGNRPRLELLLAQTPQHAALDGRMDDLGKAIPPALMPVVSAPYKEVLRWNGRGKPDERDLQCLHYLVQDAHAEGKKVRLWGIPDKPRVWAFLLSQGVDLINIDKLEEFRRWVTGR